MGRLANLVFENGLSLGRGGQRRAQQCTPRTVGRRNVGPRRARPRTKGNLQNNMTNTARDFKYDEITHTW
jgi:hypothetical protein